MRNLKFLAVAAALALGAYAAAALAGTNKLPVPSGVAADGEILVGVGGNDVIGTATPSISGSLTLGASGTAITQIRVYSVTLTGGTAAANGCSTVDYALAGIATTDKLMVNVALNSPAVTNARASTGADAFLLTFCNPGNNSSTAISGAAASIVAIRSS